MRSRSRCRSSSIELPKRVRLLAQETGRQSVVISRVLTMPELFREFTRSMRIVSSYAVRGYSTKKQKVWNVFRSRRRLRRFIPIREKARRNFRVSLDKEKKASK